MEKRKKWLQIRMSDYESNKLKQIAKSKGKTVSDMIREDYGLYDLSSQEQNKQ